METEAVRSLINSTLCYKAILNGENQREVFGESPDDVLTKAAALPLYHNSGSLPDIEKILKSSGDGNWLQVYPNHFES